MFQYKIQTLKESYCKVLLNNNKESNHFQYLYILPVDGKVFLKFT